MLSLKAGEKPKTTASRHHFVQLVKMTLEMPTVVAPTSARRVGASELRQRTPTMLGQERHTLQKLQLREKPRFFEADMATNTELVTSDGATLELRPPWCRRATMYIYLAHYYFSFFGLSPHFLF